MQTQHPLAVITPTLDGDVLAVLAGADAAYTAGVVRRLLPDRSYEGIRKVLTRLASQGIVLAEPVGNVVSYRLNREHLAAPHVVALADLRTALIERVRARVEGWPDRPLYAAIFGSAARGEMQPESDIDLFLVDPGGDVERWEAHVDALLSEVTRWTGNDARVLSMTVAELRSAVTARDPVVRSLLDDALTFSGDPAWLRRIALEARP